jgi:DNA-binding MarR family transcriptional regulator
VTDVPSGSAGAGGSAGSAGSAGAAGEPAEIAGALRIAVNRLAYALRRPGTAYGLTPSRYTALATLAKHGAMRAGDLADAMAIARPTLSRLLDTLGEDGWVVREPDPADRRASVVELSEQGHEVMDRIRREATSDLCDDIAALPPDRREILEAAVPVLVEVAELQLARGNATAPSAEPTGTASADATPDAAPDAGPDAVPMASSTR